MNAHLAMYVVRMRFARMWVALFTVDAKTDSNRKAMMATIATRLLSKQPGRIQVRALQNARKEPLIGAN